MTKDTGYLVEYDSDTQVCIIPKNFIPLEDMALLMKMYNDLGYKYWLVADTRCGFIFSKKDCHSILREPNTTDPLN